MYRNSYDDPVLSLGDFHECDGVEEPANRRDKDRNPYRKLLLDFLRSGRDVVVHEFADTYEAGRFHSRVYSHQKAVGGVKVRKRGTKVYLVRE